jgi:hypothetical protein
LFTHTVKLSFFQGKLGNCWFVAAASVLAGKQIQYPVPVPTGRVVDRDPDSMTFVDPDSESGSGYMGKKN